MTPPALLEALRVTEFLEELFFGGGSCQVKHLSGVVTENRQREGAARVLWDGLIRVIVWCSAPMAWVEELSHA